MPASKIAVVATVVGIVLAGMGHIEYGDAAPAKKSAASRKAKASRKTPRGSNMPRNFVWPPSQAMRDAEQACEHALDDAGVKWTRAGSEGHIADAMTIGDDPASAKGAFELAEVDYAPVYGKSPYKLDCQLALALHGVGEALYAAGVREVRFGSIYRWSKVRVGGKTKNVLSRHALGLAMDVVSFVDADGREANVARDYNHGDALLLAVEQAINASGAFRLVLTPKNDPISHKDHFHIEANPSYAQPPPRS